MSGLPGLQYSDDIVPPSPKRARLDDRAVDEEAEFDLDDEDFYEDAQKPSQPVVQQAMASLNGQVQDHGGMSSGLPGLAFPDATPATPPSANPQPLPQVVETPQAEEVEEPNFYEATPIDQSGEAPQVPKIEPVPAPDFGARQSNKKEDGQSEIPVQDNAMVDHVASQAQTPATLEPAVKTGGSSLLDDLDLLIQPQINTSEVAQSEDAHMAPSEVVNETMIEQSGEALDTALRRVVGIPEPVAVVEDSTAQKIEILDTNTSKPSEVETAGPSSSDLPHTAKATDDKEFLAMAEANKSNPNAEWQFDSSDAESSDTSSSDDSSSDDDSDDGELLDPETQAKMLLEAIGDDEDGPAPSGPLKTVNEKDEEILPKPEITITPETEITELGFVDSIVGNFMLIKGITTGTYRVVEAGSALCTADRTVIGAVMEPMGRVQQPMYSMGFKDAAELSQAGVEKGTKIFYVNDHSTYVFTEPLKALKGTDASNIHDEETGMDEVEFSDDEKEAEYKRNVKQAKKDRKGGDNPKQNRQENHQQGVKGKQPFKHPDASSSNGHAKPMSYDDNDDDEEEGGEIYHRLSRPDNLHEMMSYREPVEDRSNRGRPGQRGRGNDRGFGRGGRGGQGNRGGGRGQTPQRDFNKGGRGRGQGQGQQGGFQNVPTGPRNGSQHNSPKGKGKNKNRREYSNSPRPSSRSQYEESTSNPQRTPPPMPPPLPQYPAAPVAGQGYPPLPPPPPLDPAALMAMLPPGSHFNPQLFAQNLMQHAQGQQQQPPQQQQYAAPPPPADPRLRNSSQTQQQQQWQAPPPPPQNYQQYPPPPPMPLSQQYAYGAQQQQAPPAQPNVPQGQIDLAAFLRNLTGGRQN